MKNKNTVKHDASINNIYSLNGRVPIMKAIPFGLQHILAMFVANIAPILIVGAASGLDSTELAALIQSAMMIAGIGTLIQLFPLWRIGSGLPIVMGISFTFVSICCYIGAVYGYGAVMGAVLIGGIIEGLLGLFARYWMKLITPVIAATVVTAIGFSLLSVGSTSFGGGSGSADFGSAKNWILGSITLVCCIGFNILAKSYFKQLSVLFGLVVGYIVAIFMGMVDFSSLSGTGIIAFPHFMPFKLEFRLDAIFSVVLIFLVSATETIGDTTALAASGLKRDVTQKEISGSLACDGFVSSVSALFGCLPITSFSQNVGLVAMTKVDGIHLNRAVNAGICSNSCKVHRFSYLLSGEHRFSIPGNWMCLFFFTGRNVSVQFDLTAGRTECRFYFFLVVFLFDRDQVKVLRS